MFSYILISWYIIVMILLLFLILLYFYWNILYCFKGCGMGTLFVLVSPSFRENVVVTCKIGSFLCSFDNLLLKNIIVFFFGNQIPKWRSFEKRAIFDLLFTFFSHQGKLQKFIQHISHSHTCILLTLLLTFFAVPILKKIQIYQVQFLFGMISGVDSYSCQMFWNKQQITKW